MSRRGRGSAAFSLFAFQDIITSVTGIMILVTLILSLELIERKEGSPVVQTEATKEQMRQAAVEAEQIKQTISDNQKAVKVILSKLSKRQGGIDKYAGEDAKQLERQLASFEEMSRALRSELSRVKRQQRKADQRKQRADSTQEKLAATPDKLKDIQEQLRKKKAQLAKLKNSNRRIVSRAAGESRTPWLVEIKGAGLLVAEVGKNLKPRSFSDVASFLAWVARRDRNSEYFVLFVSPAGIAQFMKARDALRKMRFGVSFSLITKDETAIDSVRGAAL